MQCTLSLPHSELSCSHFLLPGLLLCPLALKVHLSSLGDTHPFPQPSLEAAEGIAKGGQGLGGDVSGRGRGRGSGLGPGEDWLFLVGGDSHYQPSGHIDRTERMDFLQLHLPGLHQALRGALDSFSAFVSYLMGDEVPTVEKREAGAAEELGEVAADRRGRPVEEEAQEALGDLGSRQSKGDGGVRRPGEAGRDQEGSSTTEQTWGWGEGSSHGSQADRQHAGAWEAAKATRCQEPSAPLEARKKSKTGSEAGQDRSSQAQESHEPEEQEVNKRETLRTWEQEEEEEEVRAREPGVAGGAESEWTWHRECEEKAGADGQKVAGDARETEQVLKEAGAEEIQGPGAKGAGREEEVVVVVGDGQTTRAQGTQEPGEESEDGAASGREEADFLGAGEGEYGAVLGKRIPEGTGRVWALQEAYEGDQEEGDENREDEVSLFPKQTQALETEGVKEVAKDQTAGREAAEYQESEGEIGKGFEIQADQGGKEAEGRQDSEIRAAQAGLKEMVQAEEAKEERQSCQAAEAELPQDKAANEAEGDTDLEATPEARPEKEFMGERSEEEAQMDREASGVEWGGLEHVVSEGQEPELTGGPKTPTEQPEEGQACKEELWSIPALSKEETEGSLEEYPSNMGYVKPDTSEAEVWENQRRRRDVERGHSQEEKADAEEVEVEAAEGQALKAEAEGGQESTLPEAECGAEEGEAAGAESQEPGGRHGTEAGRGQPLGESDARETKDEELEAAVPSGANQTSETGWRLEEAALSLQDSEDTWDSSLAAEVVNDKAALCGRTARAGEGPKRETGETFGRGWDSEGGEEGGGGEELVEAAEGENRGEQESGLEGSAEEEVTGRSGQAEDFEAREGEPWGGQAEVGEPTMTEGSCGMDGFTSGSQAAGAEGTMDIVEAKGLPGGQTLLEKEAGGWQVREQGQGREGQCGDHHPEAEARRLLAVEDAEVTGDQRAEAEEIDPENLVDVQGQEGQSTNQDHTEAEPGPPAKSAESTGGDAHGSWNEALLPGSRLDVSVPRSRVLLSRSSSQRRCRPSFRRTPAPEQQEEPPSPPLKEELSAPEQRLLQPEEPPEPSPPRPEGTPVPTRRRPLGHGEVESCSQHL
ncbi:apolipoprotein B receptor isoform X2 [Equus asinus]|uniref:apolipoprotein B receptor isoform X2 n=1 Tax=Equus asinus TaxID=9793 RepID=UPI0038F62EF8